MSMSDLRVCVPRIIPIEYRPETMARALSENPANRIAMPASAERALSTAGGPGLRLGIYVTKRWQNGRVLKCRFLDGSAKLRRRVEAKARLWEPHCNIRFRFGTFSDAEIRISFRADPGSWSAVGTDALVQQWFPRYQPTMNFGWLRDDSPDEEAERVVVHEFGHALGAVHEHQQPRARLRWNKEVIYRYFQGPPNYWSKEDVDHNVFERYSRTEVNSTRFDSYSIMLYVFPAEFFLGGGGTNNNTRLSAGDKSFIAKMYPKR